MAVDSQTIRRKKIPGNRGFFFRLTQRLQWLNVRSLLAFRASGYFERDALVLLQRFEAVRLNRREVSEQIFAAFIRSDKAETLRIIEPFYDASCHYNFLFQLVGLAPVLDRLKKQERNDRQTALLPRIQRSRIIPIKSQKTRFQQNKLAARPKNPEFPISWPAVLSGSTVNIGHHILPSLRKIKRFAS
jgi:hypothetical protein